MGFKFSRGDRCWWNSFLDNCEWKGWQGGRVVGVRYLGKVEGCQFGRDFEEFVCFVFFVRGKSGRDMVLFVFG